MAGNDTTNVELETGECALIVGEDDGSITVRVMANADVPTDSTDMPAAPEIVLALAKRLLKDPDFHDDVLDWFYAHQDESDEEDGDDDE